MALTDLFRRRDDADAVVASVSPATYPCKVLPKLLAALRSREQPVLLDLGPVVGPNLTFFGEQLRCKVYVEDLFADIDRHVRAGTTSALPAFLATRFDRIEGGVDGILCWDVFDFLDKPAAVALAGQLTRLLRPDGVALALFATTPAPAGEEPGYTKRTIVDDATVRHRKYPAAQGRRAPLLNRDIGLMFEPARVVEQLLLKTNVREVLIRKPGA